MGWRSRANKLYFEQDLTGPTLFLLGNEARGFEWTKLDQDWDRFASVPVEPIFECFDLPRSDYERYATSAGTEEDEC